MCQMVSFSTEMITTLKWNLTLDLMILSALAFLFVVLVRMILNLIPLQIIVVVMLVLSKKLKALLQVLQLHLILELLLNKNRNLFLKPLMSVCEVVMNKPTPSQIVQLVLDVLGAIGMALLAIFK